jgi:hypothetical protein
VKILDLSAGNRAIWFDKRHRDAIYLDIRPETSPDIVADSRALPVEVGDGYDLILFDPPHVNFGTGDVRGLSRSYGQWTTAHIRDTIEGTAREAHRVAKPDALMAFKWNDHSQSFARVLSLMAPWWEPLFGTTTSRRTKHPSQTQWIMLRRRSDVNVLRMAAE